MLTLVSDMVFMISFSSPSLIALTSCFDLLLDRSEYLYFLWPSFQFRFFNRNRIFVVIIEPKRFKGYLCNSFAFYSNSSKCKLLTRRIRWILEVNSLLCFIVSWEYTIKIHL